MTLSSGLTGTLTQGCTKHTFKKETLQLKNNQTKQKTTMAFIASGDLPNVLNCILYGYIFGSGFIYSFYS